MKTVISSLESTVESLSKIAGAAFKFVVAVGGICVITYAMQVGHFPQGISLGDGLLFLLAAACFGGAYALFVAFILSLGICLSPVLRPVLKLIFRLFDKVSGAPQRPMCKLADFNWFSVPFFLIGLIFILGLGVDDVFVYGVMLLLSILLYVFYSIAMDTGERYRSNARLMSVAIETPEKERLLRAEQVENFRNVQLVCIATIAIMPLFVSGAFGYILNDSMRLAQVRIENPIIYAKAPYSTMLPNELTISDARSPEGYTAYKGVTVLFKGFGSTTVVSFPDNGKPRQLDIPNELIELPHEFRLPT